MRASPLSPASSILILGSDFATFSQLLEGFRGMTVHLFFLAGKALMNSHFGCFALEHQQQTVFLCTVRPMPATITFDQILEITTAKVYKNPIVYSNPIFSLGKLLMIIFLSKSILFLFFDCHAWLLE
jgi:hypothetical protein